MGSTFGSPDPDDEGKLTLIGYWLGPGAHAYPDARDSVDRSWDPAERDTVIAHLQKGAFFRGFLGLATCRFCSCRNGASEFSDGTYYWPQGLPHYLEQHGVRLPQRFVDHVLRGSAVKPKVPSDRLEEAKVYTTWWLGKTWRKGPGPVGVGVGDFEVEYLEMLRQQYATETLLYSGEPFLEGIAERLGQPGKYLALAIREAQRQHELLYGPLAPPWFTREDLERMLEPESTEPQGG